MKNESAWLICYDIANPKRLNRVHWRVSQQATLIQYSVYYLRANERELEYLIASLRRRIDPKEDDIRIYPISATPGAAHLGHDPIAGGLLQSGLREAFILSEPDTTPHQHPADAKGKGKSLIRLVNYPEAVEEETRISGD